MYQSRSSAWYSDSAWLPYRQWDTLQDRLWRKWNENELFHWLWETADYFMELRAIESLRRWVEDYKEERCLKKN